jgi:hypothetical protein
MKRKRCEDMDEILQQERYVVTEQNWQQQEQARMKGAFRETDRASH